MQNFEREHESKSFYRNSILRHSECLTFKINVSKHCSNIDKCKCWLFNINLTLIGTQFNSKTSKMLSKLNVWIFICFSWTLIDDVFYEWMTNTKQKQQNVCVLNIPKWLEDVFSFLFFSDYKKYEDLILTFLLTSFWIEAFGSWILNSKHLSFPVSLSKKI